MNEVTPVVVEVTPVVPKKSVGTLCMKHYMCGST